jgi:hypothetical protein
LLVLMLGGAPLRAQDAELAQPTPAPMTETTAAPSEELVAPPAPAQRTTSTETPAAILPADVKDAGKLLLATAGSGVAGAVLGVAAGALLATVVAGSAAVAVRFGDLAPNASRAGIATFLYVPPLVLAASGVAGYLAGRAAAPWLAPWLAGPRVRGAAHLVKWSAVFVGLDLAAHVALGIPLALGLVGIGLGMLVTTIFNPAASWFGAPARGTPTALQVSYVVTLAYAVALLALAGPPLLAVWAVGVPAASLLVTGALQKREEP